MLLPPRHQIWIARYPSFRTKLCLPPTPVPLPLQIVNSCPPPHQTSSSTGSFCLNLNSFMFLFIFCFPSMLHSAWLWLYIDRNLTDFSRAITRSQMSSQRSFRIVFRRDACDHGDVRSRFHSNPALRVALNVCFFTKTPQTSSVWMLLIRDLVKFLKNYQKFGILIKCYSSTREWSQVFFRIIFPV